jgi:formylglycine-generating enzyme required for sulfatase activity
MSELTIKEYQKIIDEWVQTVGVRYFSELTNLAQLMEEVGEVARIMSRVYGDQSFKKSEENYDLGDEIADVLFVLVCIANQTGTDLTRAIYNNLEKKTKRDKDRHWQNPKLAPEPVFTDPAVGMEFVFVPPGVFMMGDTFDEGSDNEKPAHEVRVTGFYLGKYPVTQGQWKQVTGNNPSKFQRGHNYPVEQVTWDDVQEFIRKLTELTSGKYQFRLPTEAEWEYAARSGGKAEIYSGGDNPNLAAWYDENSGESTHPVGRKAPNGLGIFDMSGNVWEWCRDIYREDAYQRHTKENPVETEGGSDRVIRGGSWNVDAWSIRCSRRFGFSSDYRGSGLGFRLVTML